jgi:hypothetical protein
VTSVLFPNSWVCCSRSSSSSSSFSSTSTTTTAAALASFCSSSHSRRRTQCRPQVSLRSSSNSGGGAASSGGGGGGAGDSGKRHRHRKPKQPGMFEVRVITPPPKSLGVYELPPLTHNGEELVIDGEAYVVQRLVLQYKLRGGKYHRDHNALEVTPTGRWFTEQMLTNLMQARYVGPTGPQD